MKGRTMPRCERNILSVDLEDWFHILKDGYTREDWGGLDSRVEANADRLLALFEECAAHAIFFVVGWLAERQPELVRRISRAGHEIGSHSYWHEVVRRHTRQSLAADLENSKKLLEDLTGAPVRGFRAPGGSITRETAWAFDVIAEAGFEFDASVSPGYSSYGGYDTPFPGPHRIRTNAGELLELPNSTLGVGRWRLPYAGGGYSPPGFVSRTGAADPPSSTCIPGRSIPSSRG
jgi:polysaccharide deacetylase family protein (PEP-CTERM system associated)